MDQEEKRRRNRVAVAKYRAANRERIRQHNREAKAQWYAQNIEQARLEARGRYHSNVEAARVRSNAYGTEHAKERAERAAKWRLANPERVRELSQKAREKRKERWIEFLESERKRYRRNYAADPGKYSAKGAARRAATLRATPSWCDLADVIDIYRRAQQLSRETGIEHDVDHIIPLRGKTVWGLHIPINLQILTSSQNRRKFNRLIHDRTPAIPTAFPAAGVATPPS